MLMSKPFDPTTTDAKPFGSEISVLPAHELLGGFNKPDGEVTFGGAVGCRQGPSFKSDELARLQTIIQDRMHYNAQNLNPAQAHLVKETDLSQYHTISQHFPHNKMLTKTGRILTQKAVDEIKSMSFFDYVRSEIGDFILSDEDNVGHEQVCMRVVRPNMREDVGSLHRDSWFWEHYNWPVPEGMQRLKVWVPIYVNVDRAGLILVPGSHRMDTPYNIDQSTEKMAFVPGFEADSLEYRRFVGEAGDPIMFNYHLLHVGSFNTSTTSRVSIEFTIMK